MNAPRGPDSQLLDGGPICGGQMVEKGLDPLVYLHGWRSSSQVSQGDSEALSIQQTGHRSPRIRIPLVQSQRPVDVTVKRGDVFRKARSACLRSRVAATRWVQPLDRVAGSRAASGQGTERTPHRPPKIVPFGGKLSGDLSTCSACLACLSTRRQPPDPASRQFLHRRGSVRSSSKGSILRTMPPTSLSAPGCVTCRGSTAWFALVSPGR